MHLRGTMPRKHPPRETPPNLTLAPKTADPILELMVKQARYRHVLVWEAPDET